MGNFAVIHVTKGKGTGSGLGNHIDRIETKDNNGNLKNNFNNADPIRRSLNKEFAQDKFKNLSLAKAVSLRIDEGYKSFTKGGELKKISKDAVRFVEVMLTGSNERMKEIESSPGELDNWVKANYQFACKKYGEENIVRFSLHLDETTPHIHCVIVPLTEDGRLSAKEIVGNRDVLKNLQDSYAAAMESFGLKRGIEGSLAEHTGKIDYIKKQNLAVKEVEELIVKKKAFGLDFGLDLGVNETKTIENLTSALIEAKTDLKMRNFDVNKIKTNSNYIKKENLSLKNENLSISRKWREAKEEVEEVKKEAQKNYRNMVLFPKIFNDVKKQVEDEEEKKQRISEEKNQSKNRGFRR